MMAKKPKQGNHLQGSYPNNEKTQGSTPPYEGPVCEMWSK